MRTRCDQLLLADVEAFGIPMRGAVASTIRFGTNPGEDGFAPRGPTNLWQRLFWQSAGKDETLEFGPRHKRAAGNFCYPQITLFDQCVEACAANTQCRAGGIDSESHTLWGRFSAAAKGWQSTLLS